MDMVSLVVEVLDMEGSVYDLPGSVLRSRIPKKRPIRRLMKRSKSSPPGGVSTPVDKSKERIRKIVKKQHPTKSMEWDGNKWVVRKLDSSYYTDEATERLEKMEQIEQKMLDLTEIARTIGIGVSLAKMRQHQNKVRSGVQKMNSLANALKSAPDDAARNRIDSLWRIAKGGVDQALANMEMFSALLTTSGSLGLEKTLIKKLKTTRRR